MRAQLSDERCAAKRQIEVLAPARAPQKLDSFGQQPFFLSLSLTPFFFSLSSCVPFCALCFLARRLTQKHWLCFHRSFLSECTKQYLDLGMKG